MPQSDREFFEDRFNQLDSKISFESREINLKIDQQLERYHTLDKSVASLAESRESWRKHIVVLWAAFSAAVIGLLFGWIKKSPLDN